MVTRATEFDKQLGAKIEELRLSRGLTREELGAAAGVTFQQIAKYVKGTNRIPLATLKVFAKFLNRPMSYFLEDEEEVVPSKRDRLSLEMLRAFNSIEKEETKEVLVRLARSFSEK